MNTLETQLPRDLSALVEAMAERVHDVWMSSRIEEGWIYGKECNDRLKTHPCIIPYTNLPESEKDYDRNTAISTLKFILEKGYRVDKIK